MTNKRLPVSGQTQQRALNNKYKRLLGVLGQEQTYVAQLRHQAVGANNWVRCWFWARHALQRASIDVCVCLAHTRRGMRLKMGAGDGAGRAELQPDTLKILAMVMVVRALAVAAMVVLGNMVLVYAHACECECEWA